KRVEAELRHVIVGQDYLLDRLLVGLLARGHVLIEGVPGLAKTLAVKTLAQTLAIDFQRIQFTPDLLPADLVGTLIYDQRSGDFLPRRGPVFSHVVLAGLLIRIRKIFKGHKVHSPTSPFLDRSAAGDALEAGIRLVIGGLIHDSTLASLSRRG